MTATELTSYLPLIDALKVPLADEISQRDRLRQQVTYAESYGVIVSGHRRKLLVDVEQASAEALQNLKNQDIFNKYNAEEKKLVLASEISQLNAELEFVSNLENLIKRRTSLGQSILNSINNETQSAYTS
jgi:hypothetical protein